MCTATPLFHDDGFYSCSSRDISWLIAICLRRHSHTGDTMRTCCWRPKCVSDCQIEAPHVIGITCLIRMKLEGHSAVVYLGFPPCLLQSNISNFLKTSASDYFLLC